MIRRTTVTLKSLPRSVQLREHSLTMVTNIPEVSWFRFKAGSEQYSRSPRKVRTVWISDVHLGTRASGAAMLLDFLREYECDTLYIVGDLIDIWQMRRNAYWPQQHNDVVQKILRKSRKGLVSFTSLEIMTRW